MLKQGAGTWSLFKNDLRVDEEQDIPGMNMDQGLDKMLLQNLSDVMMALISHIQFPTSLIIQALNLQCSFTS